MVYFKHAYRPTSPHSPNQQIHAYKNSNVNKICVPDIRFFSSVEIWRLFLFMHLPSCLPPSPLPLVKLETMVVVNKVY